MSLTHEIIHVHQDHFRAVWARCCTTPQHAPLLNGKTKNKISGKKLSTSTHLKTKSLTINPFKHGEHGFMVVVIKKPNAGILIVFFKRNYKIINMYQKTITKPIFPYPVLTIENSIGIQIHIKFTKIHNASLINRQVVPFPHLLGINNSIH